MKNALAGLLLLFHSYAYGLPSKLGEFEPKYVLRYTTGGIGNSAATLVLGTFPGDEELMGISKQGTGGLYLLPFRDSVAKVADGKSFATQWYQPLRPDLESEVVKSWMPDDNFFSFTVQKGADGLVVKIGSGTFPSISLSGNNWVTEFSDVRFETAPPTGLRSLVGTYQGMDPEGKAVTVRVTKGSSGFFGKDLVIDVIYPGNLVVQKFIDLPESLLGSDGRGGPYMTRSRFEPPNRLIVDQLLFKVPRWRRIYELVEEDGQRKLQIKDITISIFSQKEKIVSTCVYALVEAATR